MAQNETDKKKAEELKTLANEYFKGEKYPSAIEAYTEAIMIDESNAVYYANRSIANLRIENFGYALADASKAIEIDRTYLKAYYRRAAAYMALGKCKLALRDYEAVHKARPNDKDAKTKYVECKKIVQQMAFQKAISVEEKVVSVADTINLETMTVEDKYDGPKLESNENFKVTRKFMTDLLEHYKNQKILHKRYAFQG